MMSAFQVTNEHVSALVDFAAAHDVAVTLNPAYGSQREAYWQAVAYLVGEEQGGAFGTYRKVEAKWHGEDLGRYLTLANAQSISARYGREAEGDAAPEYSHVPHQRLLTPVEALKACDCYDYQACEVPRYLDTLAAKIIDAIRGEATRSLPGYDEAPWGIDPGDLTPTV